ncbi:MAG: AMP-binding protein [Desulfobacterales bacterium]
MPTLTKGFSAQRGTEIAIIDEFGTITWAELDERVNRLVNALRARGLARGETVAIVAGNRREWFELALACAHGGWTYVPVNWHWVVEELAYVFEDAEVAAVFADVRYADKVAEALKKERSGYIRLAVGIATGGAYGHEAFVPYEDIVAEGSPAEPSEVSFGGPMFYTSGTTGKPKGVRGMLSGNSETTLDIMQFISAGFGGLLPIPGRTLLCGPVYHSAQWVFSFFPMLGGSSVVMQHKYDSKGVLELIDRHGCTNVHLVPTQMKRLLDLPHSVKESYSGKTMMAVWHGGAPCPPKIKKEIIDWWGPKVNEYYGSTEGAIVSTISSEEWLRKGGSVGKPVEMVEVIVVDEHGNRFGLNQEGTLYFRSLLGMAFEYHKDKAKTRAAHLEPGVFTTGDMGYLDDEGYLWLSDRRIDMIISGGVNIYPAEIEGVLGGHPDVEDLAVFGIPDDEFGEQVKAVVKTARGIEQGDDLAKQLIDYCRNHLAGYKAPKTIDFVDEIPRTGTGKIKKSVIRAPYWEGYRRKI